LQSTQDFGSTCGDDIVLKGGIVLSVSRIVDHLGYIHDMILEWLLLRIQIDVIPKIIQDDQRVLFLLSWAQAATRWVVLVSSIIRCSPQLPKARRRLSIAYLRRCVVVIINGTSADNLEMVSLLRLCAAYPHNGHDLQLQM
jgi:hypothetical protein